MNNWLSTDFLQICGVFYLCLSNGLVCVPSIPGVFGSKKSKNNRTCLDEWLMCQPVSDKCMTWTLHHFRSVLTFRLPSYCAWHERWESSSWFEGCSCVVKLLYSVGSVGIWAIGLGQQLCLFKKRRVQKDYLIWLWNLHEIHNWGSINFPPHTTFHPLNQVEDDQPVLCLC